MSNLRRLFSNDDGGLLRAIFIAVYCDMRCRGDDGCFIITGGSPFFRAAMFLLTRAYLVCFIAPGYVALRAMASFTKLHRDARRHFADDHLYCLNDLFRHC